MVIVETILQQFMATVPGVDHAWLPDRYPDSIEKGHMVGSITLPGEGTTSWKTVTQGVRRNIDERMYTIRVLTGVIGHGAPPYIGASRLIIVVKERLGAYIVENKCVCGDGYRVDFFPNQPVADSGLMPRLPDVPPLVYNLNQYVGFEIYLRAKLTWPVDC